MGTWRGSFFCLSLVVLSARKSCCCCCCCCCDCLRPGVGAGGASPAWQRFVVWNFEVGQFCLQIIVFLLIVFVFGSFLCSVDNALIDFGFDRFCVGWFRVRMIRVFGFGVFGGRCVVAFVCVRPSRSVERTDGFGGTPIVRRCRASSASLVGWRGRL